MRAAGAKNLNKIPFIILCKGRTHISGSQISKCSPAAPISDRPPASQIWSKQGGVQHTISPDNETLQVENKMLKEKVDELSLIIANKHKNPKSKTTSPNFKYELM